jgi:hypothetical protein
MPDTDPGISLSHYLEHAGCAVRFTCEACQASHDVAVPAVIDRLKARGLGDEQTGIREVAQLAERPCARCGAMKWETRPGFVLK